MEDLERRLRQDAKHSEPVPLPVPGEAFGIGAVRGLREAFQGFSVLGFEAQAGVAGFVEVLLFDEDVEVVGERPEPAVEEPVGGLGEGEAVADDAGSAVFEAVDVGGVEDGGAVLRDHAVAGEGAGEVVGGQHLEGEAGLALAVGLRRGGSRCRELGVGRFEVDPEQVRQVRADAAGEMGEQDRAAGGGAEAGIGEAEQVIRMEPGDACKVASGGLASVLFVGSPEAVRAGVVKGQLHIRPRAPADRTKRPVGMETEGQLAITAELPAGKLAGFHEIDDDQMEQRLVRRGPAGPVLVQVGEFGKPGMGGSLHVFTEEVPSEK